jgi:hypothetical protein
VLAVIGTSAQEANDVVVAERRQVVLLLEEGVLRASPRVVEALDSHLRRVVELALVHLWCQS